MLLQVDLLHLSCLDSVMGVVEIVSWQLQTFSEGPRWLSIYFQEEFAGEIEVSLTEFEFTPTPLTVLF